MGECAGEVREMGEATLSEADSAVKVEKNGETEEKKEGCERLEDEE